MDAFLTCLLLTLWTEMGDRTQILSASFSIRYGRDRLVIGGLLTATILNSFISAYAGAVVAEWISEHAVLLFYAMSLIFGGVSMLAWRRRVDMLERWKTGPFLTSFLGIAILQFGNSGQFIIAGTAARTQAPEMTALGGILGTATACIAAVTLREQLAQILPLKAIRIVGGILFILTGLVLAMMAWGIFG